MATFQDLWTLLQPGPEYDGVRRACEKMWDAIPSQRQQLIYDTLSEKKSLGEFIDFNPYYALQKNANPMPHFLDGWEQDDAHAEGIPLVIVRFNRRYLCCTRATMLAHNLPYVRDVLPPDQLPY